jgi:hypothetical protein
MVLPRWHPAAGARSRDPYGRGPEADAVFDFFNNVAAGAEAGYDEGGGGGYALLGAAFGAGLAVLNAIGDPADPADGPGSTEAGDSAGGGSCSSGSEAEEGRSAEGPNAFKSGQDAQDQLQDIENAQKENQERGQSNRIENTAKSEQRLNNALKQIRSLDDAEDEFGDE